MPKRTDAVISARITNEDYDALDRLVKQRRLTVSEALRRLIRGFLRANGVYKPCAADTPQRDCSKDPCPPRASLWRPQ